MRTLASICQWQSRPNASQQKTSRSPPRAAERWRFRERNLWNVPWLLQLDPRELHHLGPFLGFVGDELTEVAGKASKRRATQISELCLDLGISERRVDLLVELF